MQYITENFIKDMIDFMEVNHIKKLSFINCTIFCLYDEDTPYKYALHYNDPSVIFPPPDKMTISIWDEKRKIITADNRDAFFRNLLISKMYNKYIYDNVD